MADASPATAASIDAAFRGVEGAISAGVFGMALSWALMASSSRGCKNLWSDRGSAYMQLLLLTSATSLLQVIHAIVDISFLLSVHREGGGGGGG